MKSITIEIAACLLAMGACGGAHASPSDESAARSLVGESSPFGLQSQSDSLFSSANMLPAMLPGMVEFGEPTMRATAFGANGSIATALSGGAQLTLWNFVENIRAQQQNEPFELTQTSLNSIQYTLVQAPSSVPLPATTWLFVMGLLGLIGSRLRLGRSNRPVAPAGALAPA